MDAEPYAAAERSAMPDMKLTPFAQVFVTLSKQEHIQLVCDARFWKSAHQRAITRMQRLEIDHQLAIEQAALREAVLRSALGTSHRLAVEQAALHEAALRSELETAQGKIRDLQKRVFGRKSEHRSQGDKALGSNVESHRSRGQQLGAPGHGRTMQPHLPAHIDNIEIDSPHCDSCGLGFADFPGTEDSEVLEIEVKAYRRVIRRRRYRKTCQCVGVPGIITAPPPARLIARGKYGISVWVHLFLSKFLYGQPTHRLLQDLSDSGLTLSEGTLTGGLQAIAPLFAPVEDALLARLRSETHWHADETRWLVFIDVEGKIGHRWYLWVFQSKSVIHYVLDPSRSADVPIAELGEASGGIVSCDRYSAYKKFVRLYPAFVLAFCWAHQRRDFLELANSYPDLAAWAFVWVDKIGELYHLNDLRLDAQLDIVGFGECDILLRQAIEKMALDRAALLNEPVLAEPARKVLQSMQNHWSGLTVFVDHPEVPMDNNSAERCVRISVVGRKNFYGSGSRWSGALAATMYSLLMTVKLWGINPRTWLSAYLHDCAENGNLPPSDLSAFLPWAMDVQQLAKMKSVFVMPDHANETGIDSS